MSDLLKTIVGLTFVAFLAGQVLSRGPLSAPTSGGGAQAAAPARASLAAPPRAAQGVGAQGFGAVVLASDSRGQFNTVVEIDGTSVPVIVDTGATFLTLTYEQAARLGRAPAPADFTVSFWTANGPTKNAALRLPEVRLANLSLSNVDAMVMPQGVASHNLLGMSFLRRLGGFQIESGNLILRP